jgi:hypothetical protein
LEGPGQEVHRVGATTVDKQRGIQLGCHKAYGDQVRDEAVVPNSKHLSQVIEELVESTHQVRVSRINKVDGPVCGWG